MADKKISELDAITGANTAADDYFVVVDTSGTATKKISRAELNNAIEADVLSTVNIDGGTIDGVTMATSDITVGSGKTLNVSAGTLTLADDQISGDKINGGSISSTFVGNLTGNVTGNASGTAATVTAGAQPNITSTGTLTSFRSTGIDDNADALAVTIDSSENVGLPTVNANYKFAVVGGAAVGAAGATVAAGETFVVTDASHVAKITVTGGTAQFGTKSAADLVFMRANGEAGRFTATGLGIGTTAPSAELHIKGAAPELILHDGASDSWTSGDVSSSLVFQARNSSVRDLAKIDAIHASTNGTIGALRFQTRHGDVLAERVRLLSDGKFGIGTSTPAQKLTIESGYTLHSGGYGLLWGSDTYVKGQGDSSQYVFLNATGTQVGISSTGNAPDLGRGLHIKYSDTTATVNAGFDNLVIEENDNNGMTILSSTGGEGGIAFGDSGNNVIGKLVYDHDGDYMAFTANAAERLRVLSDGKVAINQTSANEKLDVNGAIKVRGAVETDQASSAVFGYQFNGARFISWGADDTTRGIYRFEAFEGDGGNAINVIETNTSGSVGFGVAPTIDSSLAGLSIGGKVLHLHDTSGASLKLSDADSGANRGLGIASVGVEASISNCEAGALRFGTGNTERCRIDQSGRFMVNATGTVGYFDGQFLCQGRAHFKHDSNDMILVWNEQTSGTAYFMRFGHGSSWSEQGTITHATGGSTAYNTSSDYRLKNVGGEIENATEKIKALKPITYAWKTTPDIENEGFLAHEVAEAGFDFAVTGEKDAIKNDGSIEAQQLDQSKLIPALVKTIQELEARVATLEGD
ncbi:MAG: hypothetical protein CMP14_08440 [Rickettsiales bacterium]|nr:hypothetical protein [Rickettsiales bacterium]